MIFYSKKPAVCSSSTFIEAYHNEVLSKAKAHTFPYRRYSQEEINLFNSINTIDVSVFISEKGLSYEAGRLVVRNFPHVIVYPEGFYDTKSGKCYSTVNGLKEFFGFSFPEACYIIKRYLEGDVIFHMDAYIMLSSDNEVFLMSPCGFRATRTFSIYTANFEAEVS